MEPPINILPILFCSRFYFPTNCYVPSFSYLYTQTKNNSDYAPKSSDLVILWLDRIDGDHLKWMNLKLAVEFSYDALPSTFELVNIYYNYYDEPVLFSLVERHLKAQYCHPFGRATP